MVDSAIAGTKKQNLLPLVLTSAKNKQSLPLNKPTTMMTKEMTDALNAQINAEYYSAYLYLAMSLDADTKGYRGVAHWMYVQWLEEQKHARKLQQYLLSRDVRPILQPIMAAQPTWKDITTMMESALNHEKKVTQMIANLVRVAYADTDFATLSMLQWFVDEQVEEEQTLSDILSDFSLWGEGGASMMEMDEKLGKRVESPE